MAEKKDDLALLIYLDELAEELRTLVPQAVKDRNVDAVHDARVATRRLKAGLDLMQAVLSGKTRKPFEKVLRLLRRRLSALRDVDVMLEHLHKIKSPKHQAAVAWMVERFEKARKMAADRASDDLPGPKILSKLGAWWGVRAQIVAAVQSIGESADEAAGEKLVASLLAESVHLQLDEFAEFAAQIGVLGTNPHQLRISGKSLRYTLEMARKQGAFRSHASESRRVFSAFKRIQTALGNWHDYVVMTERILAESAEQQVAHHDPAKQQALLKLAESALRRGRAELAKVADFWRTDGLGLVAQIRASFPLTRAVAETPEPPKNEEASLFTSPALNPHTTPP